MKSNHSRLKHVLGAVMITAMIALLVWTFNSIQVSANNSATNNDLQALQAENDQLHQTLTEMQNRENAYRTQIQKANETIFQLIDQPEPTSPTLSSLQTENSALHDRVNVLEQQLQDQQATSQNSSSSPLLGRSRESEESEHEGG